MGEKRWTAQQLDAITSRGGTVLVSAAAGSGKTAVLVERVIRRILDEENPVDANRLLVVTFSNAAAIEMKQRISAKIEELLRESPSDRRLLRQQFLLSKAQISTIHSFCLELIRENFEQLTLPCDFRIADQKELELLRIDCARDVMEQLYQDETDNGFSELVELLSTGRDDRRVVETLLNLYDFVRSHPFYEDWLAQKLAYYNTGVSLAESVWGDSIFSYAEDALCYGVHLCRQALRLISEDEKMEKAYRNAYASDLALVAHCLSLVQNRDWDGVVEALTAFSFEKLGALRGYQDDVHKERVKGMRDKVKKIIENLRDRQFCSTSAEFSEDIAVLRPKVALLFEMTMRFDRLLSEQKLEKKLLDFSDLEHYALRLLYEKRDGEYVRTAAAERLSENFDEVYIDEYQDTNEAQDRIFRAVSNRENNLFMVGDVKQSIYRFRQAMPEIFLSKKQQYSKYDGISYPASIILGKNFRSRKEITDGINSVFRMLMSEKMGELAYEGEEMLMAGAVYPSGDSAGISLHVLDTSEYAGEMDKTVLEARHIAAQIAELFNCGHRVYEDGTMRPVHFRDICILMRSPKQKIQIFCRELAAQGIPVSGEQQSGFLQAIEVMAVLSVLRVIDNPLLDVELTAVLFSPMFDFTADEVAQIRLCEPQEPLYKALLAHAMTSEKVRKFLELLDRFRQDAAVFTTDQLIRRILERTGFEAIVLAMRFGEMRRENLLLLIQYAADYHNSGYKNVSGFIRLINRLNEQGSDLPGAPSTAHQSDCVRIMSIHRSKGLEFPVVFLADTAKQFNREELRANTLLHSRLGFACVRRDLEILKQFTTVPLQALRLESEAQMLSEEMRVLYVALTRAKEKLIITAVMQNPASRLQKLCVPLEGDGVISPYVVREAASYADWLVMCALHHSGGASLWEAYSIEPEGIVPDEGGFSVERFAVTDDGGTTEEEYSESCAPPPDKTLLQTIEQRTAYRYPYEELTCIPTKLGVSQIAKGELAKEYRFQKRPAFLTGESMTGAEKGNALHRFMQFADYSAAAMDVQTELIRLIAQGFFTKTEGEAVAVNKLTAFFRSPLARRIFAAETVHRELRFLAEVSQDVIGQYMPQYTGTYKTAVQGVADCVFIENGQGVIVDYKSDFAHEEQELVGKYRTQLLLYKEILQESLGVPICECILYSFCLGREIAVK